MFIDASVNFSQQNLLHQVSTEVLAMSLRDARATGEQFQHLMETADRTVQAIRDSAVGQVVNLLG